MHRYIWNETCASATKDLVGIYNHKSITKARTAGEKTGFSGVLVVCGIDNYGNAAYYAFDLCCPHEAKKEYQS